MTTRTHPLILRICIVGDAMTNRWHLALCARGRLTAAYRLGRIADRLFAGRPCMCTCRCCREAGITAPVALRAAGFVNLHKRRRPIRNGAR
jgi:hypothetical protein